MGLDDKSGDKRRNPWDKQSNDEAPQGNWGTRGSNEPPDLDELLRKAQQNFRSVMPGDMNTGKVIGLLLVAMVALWFSSGFYTVAPGEQAVIQRFGAWSRTQTEPGLSYHFPVPIESLSKVKVSEIRLMNIGFVETRNQIGSSVRRDVPEESLMLTSDRNIVDLNIVVQWNIKSAEDYLFNVYDQEATIKKVSESAVREIAGQMDMFPIITSKRAEVAARTKAILQENLDEYKSGINITQVLIEKAEVHPDVQMAFQDVQSAKQDAQDVQNRAGTYREDILPKARGRAIQMAQEAEGYKQSAIARANGDAQRFNSVYEAYLSGQDVTKERIYIETMEDVLKNAQKIILDDKSGTVPYLPLNEVIKPRGATTPADPLSPQ
jgi:membrane protease subunit HflK